MANGGAPDLGPTFPSANDPNEASEVLATILAGIQAMMPQEVGDVYGYTETPETILEQTGTFQDQPILEYTPTGEMIQTPITAEDIFDVVGGLSEEARKTFAMDMFLNAPGAYPDHEYVFNEDGSINETGFLTALTRTMGWAQQQVDLGRTDYLDILQRSGDLSPEEIATMFNERVAELEKKPERVINFIDPAALRAEVSNAFMETTGRKATTEEMKKFISRIHGLQASGVASISVGAQAGEFARSAAPVEAGAMDHVNAASLIMQVAGIGGRQ